MQAMEDPFIRNSQSHNGSGDEIPLILGSGAPLFSLKCLREIRKKI